MVEQSENPIVARIKSGQVPEIAKLNAARGLLPIAAEDLVGLLVFLTQDASSEVSGAATKTLAEFPEEQLVPIAENEATPTEVLSYFGQHPRSESVSQALLLNPGTTDEAVEVLAAAITEPLLEILIKNEVRLIRHPALLERIEGNPHASPAIRKRCQEIRTSFLRPTAAAAAPAAPAVVEEPVAEAPAKEEPVDPATVDLEEPVSAALQEVLDVEASVEAGGEVTEEQKLTLEQKIMRLTVVEKIKLAYKGGRQARIILIREPNRTISNAVLAGGKLSIQEVELISQFRNIDDEVLRRFASGKQWTKSYTVCHNLVKNPRTPIALALNLMSRLQNSDLKRLQNNNNVSGHIREQAKRISRESKMKG